ncbi:high-potential iron-sulfur protein [Novosphingobium sp. TH158]|uniref:high-potential iron-sulfur protein n=1 Tax=Novosphingobium sp. TH158 TaxID=2067455 RepID=UPI000C7D35F7|nr:high-potential iron-sulfur protein [Novosphingobium sp. TH158]PLK26206.1 hypothetical protein C0V78_04395 [Novosphingobium sp. TH158]
MQENRRRFLQWAALAPVAAIAATRSGNALANGAGTNACYDPATLPMSQKSLRRSVEYVNVSADPSKRCGLCAFYQAKGDCGSCQILTSVVSPAAYCSSYAPKAG